MSINEKDWIEQFPAGSKDEIRESLRAVLRSAVLPEDKSARILIKPNFNNDLNALTGNSTDLRLLWELCCLLKEKGFRNLALADGPNTGVFVANIDVLERLGCRRMCRLLDVECLDLNYCQGQCFKAHGGADAIVANEILEADYIINVPKIKTHSDTVFSCCVKNWMGINVGAAKWGLHVDLFNNLRNNISFRPPDLCIVDGLIAMEGNGPGDGNPVWIGTVIAGNNPFYIDCAIAKAIGLDPEKILYLCEYVKNHKSNYIESSKQLDLPALLPASERSLLAKIATSDWLEWLRVLVRPLTKLPGTMQLLYYCGIIQDVYDHCEGADRIYISNNISDEFMCLWCPSDWEKIRSTAELKDSKIDIYTSKHCIRCNYCLWADVNEMVTAKMRSRYFKRHFCRYKYRIKRMIMSMAKN